MGLFQALGVIVASVIVAAATMGTVKYHYQRETTDIEEKYINRDAAEIDELYHQTYYPTDGTLALSINGNDGTYDDNIAPTTNTPPNNDLYIGPTDFDNDGLTDREEAELGTNPYKSDTDGDGVDDSHDPKPLDPLIKSPLLPDHRKPDDWDDDGLANNEEDRIGTQKDNPDSDGDGIIDSQDPMPLDPTIGGAILPPVPPMPPTGGGTDEGGNQFIITNFYKAACNPNLTIDHTCDKDENWQIDQIEANISEVLKFKIHIELENTNTINTRYVNLFDLLPKELMYSYYPGSAAIQINQNPIHQLTQYEDDWLEEPYQSLKFTLASGQRKIYNIWFNATVLQLPAINTAEIWSTGNKLLATDSITIE